MQFLESPCRHHNGVHADAHTLTTTALEKQITGNCNFPRLSSYVQV